MSTIDSRLETWAAEHDYSLETWAAEHGYSLKQAWQRCPRGDWMLHWAEPYVERQELVLATCECARLALHLVPDDEPAPRTVIETSEAWARGDEGVTLEDVRRAAAVAYVASYTTTIGALASYYASYAAGYIAFSDADTLRATCGALAVDYAADASDDPEQVHRECATICRRHWPTLPSPEVSR